MRQVGPHPTPALPNRLRRCVRTWDQSLWRDLSSRYGHSARAGPQGVVAFRLRSGGGGVRAQDRGSLVVTAGVPPKQRISFPPSAHPTIQRSTSDIACLTEAL